MVKITTTWILSTVLYFNLNHDVSETGFCLRLQVEPTQVGPIDRTNLCLRLLAKVKVKVILRSTVSRPVRPGIRPSSGSHYNFFCRHLRVSSRGTPSLTTEQVCNVNLYLLPALPALTPLGPGPVEPATIPHCLI
jgi:hypothetical protein